MGLNLWSHLAPRLVWGCCEMMGTGQLGLFEGVLVLKVGQGQRKYCFSQVPSNFCPDMDGQWQ